MSTSASLQTAGSSARPMSGRPSKKTRIYRRRRRAATSVDSDDEIQREVTSDSETDDEIVSVGSSSGSDAEADPVQATPHRAPRLATPGTSRSPEEGPKPSSKPASAQVSSFFATASWSDMVEEKGSATADLPVIDFADLRQSSPSNTRSRKAQKGAKRDAVVRPITSLPSPPLSTIEHEDEPPPKSAPQPSPAPRKEPSSFPPRPPGQSARQAYQSRLSSDPSFVPTVGEFWGHDDRLLDKNLRSLSGWWRGRWQGRGRGRGGFPIRGRGGFLNRSSPLTDRPADGPVAPQSAESKAQDREVPAVDRAWTHDGFEEMTKNEERRAAVDQQSSRGFGGFRGRGAIRGSWRGSFSRQPFSPSSSVPRGASPALSAERVWFAMHPEKKWTKKNDQYLFFDHDLRPTRPGEGYGIRLKVPGRQEKIVRTTPYQSRAARASTVTPATSGSVYGSDAGDRTVVVKLPSTALKGKEPAAPCSEDDKVSENIEDVFTVRPQLVEAMPIPLPEQSSSGSSSAAPEAKVQQQLETLTLQVGSETGGPSAKTEAAVLRNSPSEQELSGSNKDLATQERPSVPPLETSLPPSESQSSPAFSYGYPMALPPGIAYDPQGVPYEIATGRHVYLPPSPPPPMFTPRPLMQPMPFVSGHVRHHSTVMPEYIPSFTPPIGSYVDPSNGGPIFSLPRQSSAVAIRDPSDPKGHKRSASTLRTSAAVFDPSRGLEQLSEATTEQEHLSEAYGEQAIQQNGMMVYPYHQPYYYPDTYGYHAYTDVSPGSSYEMYPQDGQVAYY